MRMGDTESVQLPIDEFQDLLDLLVEQLLQLFPAAALVLKQGEKM